MRQTKKITVSGIVVALGVVLMTLGSLFSIVDLTVCALSSLLVAFIYIEIGSPYTFLVWICTSLCSALIFPGSPVWVEYLLIFGIYPILKAYIERLPRGWWWILKLAFINADVWLIAIISELVTGVKFFGEENFIFNVVLYVIINVAFIAYDVFMTILIRFYVVKLQPTFKRFLK